MIHAAHLLVWLLAAVPASAAPLCTRAPQTHWIAEATMRQRIEADGYRIVVFKQTDGNCYEIYGRDRNDHRVEIYFDPVSGSVVKASTR